MLGDEVAGEGVQAAGEEARHEEVYEGAGPKGLHEGVIEDQLREQVEEVPLRECLCPDETWTESVKQDLECTESIWSEDGALPKREDSRKEHLAQNVIQANQFKLSR